MTEDRSLGFDPLALSERELVQWMDALSGVNKEKRVAYEKQLEEAKRKRKAARRSRRK